MMERGWDPIGVILCIEMGGALNVPTLYSLLVHWESKLVPACSWEPAEVRVQLVPWYLSQRVVLAGNSCAHCGTGNDEY